MVVGPGTRQTLASYVSMHTVPAITASGAHFLSGLAPCAQAVPASSAIAARTLVPRTVCLIAVSLRPRLATEPSRAPASEGADHQGAYHVNKGLGLALWIDHPTRRRAAAVGSFVNHGTLGGGSVRLTGSRALGSLRGTRTSEVAVQ